MASAVSRRGVRWAAAVLLLGLACTAAGANVGIGAMTDYRLWLYVALGAIVVLEAVVIRWLVRLSWPMSFLTALVANLASWQLARAARLERSLLELPDAFFVNLMLEWPVVLALTWIAYPRTWYAEKQRAWVWRALLAVGVMNLVSAPVVGTLRLGLPDRSTWCVIHLKGISNAVLTYRHERGAWPPAHDMAELEPMIAPYLQDRAFLLCPGGLQGAQFPLPSGPKPYACADFTRLADALPQASRTPIVWDSGPWHSGQYVVAYGDGHLGSQEGLPVVPPEALRKATRGAGR